MFISFERSGGFTGIPVRTTLDTEELPALQAGPLKDLVYQAGFFDLPSQLLGAVKGADRFNYRLTIRDGDLSNTVEMDDASVPENLQPLLQQLTTLSRSRR